MPFPQAGPLGPPLDSSPVSGPSVGDPVALPVGSALVVEVTEAEVAAWVTLEVPDPSAPVDEAEAAAPTLQLGVGASSTHPSFCSTHTLQYI